MIVLKISSELLRTLQVVNTTASVKYRDAITQVSRNDQMLLHISFNHVTKRAVLCLKDFQFLPVLTLKSLCNLVVLTNPACFLFMAQNKSPASVSGCYIFQMFCDVFWSCL